MEIRKDYVGNTAGKVVHGVKEAYNHNRPYKSSYKSYCGLIARFWVPKSETDVQQITCKSCRKILGLSYEQREKPIKRGNNMEIREDYIGNMTYSNVVHGLKHSKSGNEGANHSFCGLIFSQPDAISIGVDLDDNGRALLAGAVTCKTCRDTLGLMEVDTTETRKDYVGNTTGKVIHGVKRADYSHNRSYGSYCGLMAGHWIAKSKMDGMVEQITCKSCRDALGLREVDTMEIRKDYVGNTAGKVIHGVKEAYNHNRPYKSYCGLIADRPWAPKSELDGMVEQITCKACRKILGLSDKHNEKPDYFLILDTSKGIPEDVPPVVAATENKDYLKVILSKEAERVGHEHVNDFYRVVGIKEVEGTIISIKPKGYEITLTEQ